MIEVGVWTGHSLLYLMDRIAESGKSIAVFAIDLFADDVYDNNGPVSGKQWNEFHLRMSPHWKDLDVIKMDSQRSADLFHDQSVDFCFIDACHRYEAVKADLAAWWPKIKPGGVLAGHDLDYEPVARAVTEMESSLSENAVKDHAENVYQIEKLRGIT